MSMQIQFKRLVFLMAILNFVYFQWALAAPKKDYHCIR